MKIGGRISLSYQESITIIALQGVLNSVGKRLRYRLIKRGRLKLARPECMISVAKD